MTVGAEVRGRRLNVRIDTSSATGPRQALESEMQRLPEGTVLLMEEAIAALLGVVFADRGESHPAESGGVVFDCCSCA